ncbi:PALB protein [Stachybotrys elegans]|uniref:PALB protein n=1 Tax=Stachybotrys elegans TaxID=80388 RepID=A0A8K0SKK0_9HYPO|nr:PALB protein [Stachybotrys elegans]
MQAAESLIAGSDGTDALNHAIRAAELYMLAAKEASSKTTAARLRRKCQQLIALAEQLKGQQNRDGGSSLLQGSSRLHGNDFPPWDSEPSESEFGLSPGEEPYTDNAAFSMSPAQTAILDSWVRPKDLFRATPKLNHGNDSSELDDEAIFMAATPNADLTQDVTTDCSVVAGLSAAIRVLIGNQAVLASIFYPYDHKAGRPRLSASGKYVLRMHFNGCDRRVVIDDRLPSSQNDRTLFVVDRQNPRLLWPALLEKAYLKVRGGYDFPGSNSSTDLWVLTGWVPEQVFLQSEDFDLDETWARIKSAHDSQDVVVTLGTGRTSGEEEEILGLIGEHDYAVQDLSATGGTRRMLIKNPWSNGPVWKGAGWSPAKHIVCSDPVSLASPDGKATEPLNPGSIWVSLEDVAQNFEAMYLNWNPRLFPHRQETHFTWELPPKNLSASLVRNPQFSLTSSKGGLVWVLVSRHFADAELDIARNKAGSMAAVSCRLGFMSILLFDNNGHKVQTSDAATYRGPYVDSPQTLARFRITPGKPYTIAVDQFELPLPTYTFTMSIFSAHPLQVHPAMDKMSHAKEQLGEWGRRTAGGNASRPTYFTNPQYTLKVLNSTPLSVLLSTDNRDFHVHVDVVWAQGKRVMSIRERDLVTSSGEYRRGCALADAASVDPGTYTIVCSTFEPQQFASFALRVSSMVPLELTPILPDMAGKLRFALDPVNLATGEEKRRAFISLSRLARVYISVHTTDPSAAQQTNRTLSMPMIRASVVRGWGPEQTTVAATGDGDFLEPTFALRSREFDLEPQRSSRDGIWLLLENIGASDTVCGINCELYSDSEVVLGHWETL